MSKSGSRKSDVIGQEDPDGGFTLYGKSAKAWLSADENGNVDLGDWV
jgi:hypothetical protein